MIKMVDDPNLQKIHNNDDDEELDEEQAEIELNDKEAPFLRG